MTKKPDGAFSNLSQGRSRRRVLADPLILGLAQFTRKVFPLRSVPVPFFKIVVLF